MQMSAQRAATCRVDGDQVRPSFGGGANERARRHRQQGRSRARRDAPSPRGSCALTARPGLRYRSAPAADPALIPSSTSLGRPILRRVAADVRIRPMTELDIEGITRIDERITGTYRPDVWEQRVGYYIRRDAESSQVAEVGGKVAGFMMGEVRGGEFGLEEPTGWIEVFGVDPDARGRGLGRKVIHTLLQHFPAPGAAIAPT